MINKTLKKIRKRNIQTNFKQFLSVILIVFLSVTLLSGFIVNSHTLNKSIEKYYKESNLADLWVYTDKITPEDENFYVSNSIVSDKRLYFEANTKFEGHSTTNVSKVFVSDGKISAYKLESGREGCLIDKNVAKNNDVNVGIDNISLEFDFAVSETVVIPIVIKTRITGTMSYVECADTYSTWPVAFTEERFLFVLNEALQNAGLSETITELPFNQVVIKTDNIEKTKAKINAYYETADSELFYLFDRDSIESVVLLSGEVKQSQKMIYIFPIIFLVVAVLIILTTINQLVLQEKSKIGMLKSIGVPDGKILNNYSGYGAYLCAIGSIAGLIVGPIAIPEIMFVKYDLVYSIPADYISLSLPWHWLLLVFVGMVLLGYLVSFLACFEILHKKPIECLRQEFKFRVKSNGKNRIKKLPISMKMAIRNIRIKPIRTIMATLGIAGCVALLLCGFGIGDTLTHSMDNDLGGVLVYDVSTTYVSETFETDINKISGISKKEKYQEFYAEAKNNDVVRNLTIFKIEENSKFVTFGLDEKDACMTKAIADEMGIKVGDKVKVSVGGVIEEIKITNIEKTSFFNGIYLCKNLAFDEIFATDGMWFNVSGDAEKIVKAINGINGTNTAKTIDEQRDFIKNKISSISVMTTTLKVFAVLLAVVVLLNLIFLIMKERIKEIATLKVVGQNIFTIGLALFYEILTMAVIGTPIGMLLGYPLLIWILKVNQVDVMNYLYHINAVSFVISGAVILLTIVAVSLVVLVRVKKINMIESLKSVE